uniref:Farnesyl pyrophosphate synthase n=1 Tax=Pan paniscus TaxID=9597 RepID=A0A2R9ARY1_PANPA
MNGDQKSDISVQEKQDFIQCFSQIVRVLTEDEMGHPETGDYNAIGGKYHWALMVLVAFWELVEPRKQDAESLQWALTMGWCVELLQAFFLVKPGAGLDAINVAMEACMYRLLKLYCQEQPYYLNLIQLFRQSFYQTEIGQTLDLIIAPQGNVDLGRFTEKRYKSSVIFYSFYLPVAAAMYMAGIDREKEHTNAKKILGRVLSDQDDYPHLFGDPNVTAKVGTDIQDNKCSWLVVQWLQWATPEQYQILKENFGQKEAEKVAPVKAVYEELDLPEDSYSHVMGLIEQYAAPLPPVIFLGLARKIYKRKK